VIQTSCPVFLPSSSVTSKPIAIPSRPQTKKMSLLDPDELEKGDIQSFTPGIRGASVIPGHFGIFFGDFEL